MTFRNSSLKTQSLNSLTAFIIKTQVNIGFCCPEPSVIYYISTRYPYIWIKHSLDGYLTGRSGTPDVRGICVCLKPFLSTINLFVTRKVHLFYPRHKQGTFLSSLLLHDPSVEVRCAAAATTAQASALTCLISELWSHYVAPLAYHVIPWG